MDEISSWIEKSKKNINIKYSNDQYVISYMGISSKIARPNKKYQYYLVSSHDNLDYEWYDAINRYCIEMSPNLEKILNKIIKYIEKYNKSQDYTSSESITKNNTSDISIDDFNLEYYKMKSKLSKMAETSSSSVVEYGNVKSMYDQKTIANILISEFWIVGNQ